VQLLPLERPQLDILRVDVQAAQRGFVDAASQQGGAVTSIR
jgi:hypothetical protein